VVSVPETFVGGRCLAELGLGDPWGGAGSQRQSRTADAASAAAAQPASGRFCIEDTDFDR